MSDTTGITSDAASDVETAGDTRRKRGGSGLASMLMPELQQLAHSLGISGIGRMRKSELITAIQSNQSGQPKLSDTDGAATSNSNNASASAKQPEPESTVTAGRAMRAAGPPQPRRAAVVAAEVESPAQPEATATVAVDDDGGDARATTTGVAPTERRERRQRNRPQNNAESGADQSRGGDKEKQSGGGNERGQNRGGGRGEGRDSRDNRGGDDDKQSGGGNDRGQNRGSEDDKRRNRRHRDRRDRRGRGDRGDRGQNESQVNDDDVLVPVAGIVDILDNYAFLRTTGYLAGSTDVYVSMSQVRKNGLRRGDAVTGMVKAPREDDNGGGGGKRREKYNPLVRLDTVNGAEPEQANKRPDFYKLTPLYPQERLRLETESQHLTQRVIDLVTPIGKGQRALIVSPPKAGKTMVLQSVANSITTNNPECHLMVVLVDERPEEVTDMQRSVKGEVISSTFDRHPSDHTTVAELSIERAKRLVELGHDVVVLLDSITRLGRAYNNASPASGRILSGGIDSTALYPPKKFLGAARNIENGGSLTILATALVETGSMGDTVIFEEFKGTGNAELKLDRKIADKRTYPAVDVHQSSTRKDDLMMGPDEQAIMVKLRRVLSSLESQQAIELLLEQLKKNKTNAEFLMQIAKNTPGSNE